MKSLKSIFLVVISAAFTVMVSCQCMAVTNPATTATPLADDLDINQYSLLNVKKIMDIRNAAEFSSIQAAIDDLPSTGGMVFIPAGTYTLSASLKLKNNLALVGAGWSTILKVGNSIQANAIGEGSPAAAVNNVLIANLQIDGNKANQTAGAGWQSGICFVQVTQSCIENVYIHDTAYSGITLYNQSNNNTIMDCHIINTGGLLNPSREENGIEIRYASSRNRIIGNQIENLSDHGITIAADGIEILDNIISDNIIRTATRRGISVGSDTSTAAVTRTTIANNQVIGGQDGLYVYEGTAPVDNTVVSGNLVLNYTGDGIFAGGSNVKKTLIQANIVRSSNSGTRGIRITGTDTVVNNNIVLDNANAQISDAGTRTVLSGNKEDTTTPGLTVKGLVGLSSGQTAANNLRGTLTIPNGNTTGTVTFGTGKDEPDTSYYLTVTPTTYTGTPASGSNRIKSISKTTTGFTVTLEAAPGTGKSVTFDWHLIR